MSKKSKKKLKKKDRKSLLKAALNSRKAGKLAKKAAVKLAAARNGHAAAKVRKGRLVYFFGEGRSDGDGRMKFVFAPGSKPDEIASDLKRLM